MRSAIPKVLHAAAGRTLVGHVVAAAAQLDPEHLVVIVGHARERVVAHLAEVAPAVRTVVQEHQLGTGHAVRVALDALAADGITLDGPVVVLPGDAPLLTAETLALLVATHVDAKASSTLLTAVMDDPTGYGRVVRGEDGSVQAITEHKDADEAVLAVREVNTSVYAFDAVPLREALGRLRTDNSQGEEYLTDVVADHVGAGRTVAAVAVADPEEASGVNDRVQLHAVRRALNDRLLRAAMLAGADVHDPATTWLDVTVTLEPDCTVLPHVQLRGSTVIRRGATVGPECTLTDTEVGEGAVVRRATCEQAVIGPEATVGPYTYLRPGTVLGRRSKAGGFVEMKAAELGEGAKVPHLSYVGDASIGAGSNIGAATVFVNYDGVAKHRITVGAEARIGSDTMLVAPVSIGDGAYTAAGSVITDDVPAGAMGVGRARQRTIEGWVARRRAGSAAAEAAAKAQHEGTVPAGDGPDPTQDDQQE